MTFVSYAQNYEDVILWRAFRNTEAGHYIDIGAHDPVVDSVSFAFYQAGWRGMHVEPTPTYAAKLREARPDEIVIEAAVADVLGPIRFHEIPETGLSTGRADIARHHCQGGWVNREIVVPCIRLDKIFEMAAKEVHWLKIDVEGMEADVLRSWGESPVRPWLVVVEATYPSTQRSTKDLWINEVLGRGYREVYFDGLSSYFLHEAHADLSDRFATPPNVFDGFHVASTHFSAGMVTQDARDELDRAVAKADQCERQLESELAGARQEVEAVSVKMRELESARASDVEQLSASERQHRATVDRAWRERHEAEAALRRSWGDLENELRNRLAAADIQLREGGAELATQRERAARLQDRIEELGQERDTALQEAAQLRNRSEKFRDDVEAGRLRIARLETEIATLQSSYRDLQDQLAVRVADSERQLAAVRVELAELHAEKGRALEAAAAESDNLARQLGERDAIIARADGIIAKALAEPLDRWQRIGRALSLSRGEGVKRALRSWDLNSSQPAAGTVDAYMSFISPGEARNPYLRANSLSELLAWNDVDFVRCAYVTILGRQPDAEGERHYTDRIRHGCSKMKVLWQLRTSREGPRHDPGIAGLDRALRRAKRASMPFVGVFFRLWTGDEGDGAAAKRHRMVANELGRVMGLQQRLLEEQNKLLGRIDRPSVILPSAVQVANDGRASPQDKAVTTSHVSQDASAGEPSDTHYLSAEARKLYHLFTGAC